mmetsp:Transcript_51362/g.100842  ORF Transcript_51362/g.100842 Transcript_51362/m.100842 type:complete len:94 (-) Transcript_51362:397-678(-)
MRCDDVPSGRHTRRKEGRKREWMDGWMDERRRQNLRLTHSFKIQSQNEKTLSSSTKAERTKRATTEAAHKRRNQTPSAKVNLERMFRCTPQRV